MVERSIAFAERRHQQWLNVEGLSQNARFWQGEVERVCPGEWLTGDGQGHAVPIMPWVPSQEAVQPSAEQAQEQAAYRGGLRSSRTRCVSERSGDSSRRQFFSQFFESREQFDDARQWLWFGIFTAVAFYIQWR